jgi:hypothetical protein
MTVGAHLPILVFPNSPVSARGVKSRDVGSDSWSIKCAVTEIRI